MQVPSSHVCSMIHRPILSIVGLIVVLAVGLLAYSQTMTFNWDEGFHLLTAQLILRGQKPYIDFVFPQTPLNAYWNAMWMHLFDDTWRTVHAVAAVVVALAVFLTADYVFRRFPVVQWRFPCAVMAAIVVGMNVAVVGFGTDGQAYALCLLSIVAAFYATVVAVERRGVLLPALAGFFASAAANASLLTAAVGPTLLIWMLAYNRNGSRWLKLCGYALAAVIPALPLLWLFAQGPTQTLFNVFNYHFFYRQVAFHGAIPHDIDVMISWLDSAQALPLALLAIVGRGGSS